MDNFARKVEFATVHVTHLLKQVTSNEERLMLLMIYLQRMIDLSIEYEKEQN